MEFSTISGEVVGWVPVEILVYDFCPKEAPLPPPFFVDLSAQVEKQERERKEEEERERERERDWVRICGWVGAGGGS